MSDVVDINTKKTKIARLLSEATATSPAGQARPIQYLTIATVICLIGATIPHLAIYRLFGQSSLFCLLLLLFTAFKYRKQLPGKQIKRFVAIVVVTMLLTGCSGLLMPDMSTTPLIEYLHEADREYKTGHAGGIGIFGFGLYDATVEAAMTNGNITKAYAAETNSSFGWIAVARVKVYGE